MSAGKKRFCSGDEKREICGQTRVEGALVAQVAGRYAVNANLTHKWLRDPRFSRETERVADLPSVDGCCVLRSKTPKWSLSRPLVLS